MKILIVNTSDVEGGAARAAYRLHRSLLSEGVDSQMLVQARTSDDLTVVGPVTKIQKGLGKIRPFIDKLPVQRYKNRTATLFSPAWLPFSGIVDRINKLGPDIVHLHWVADGMMRIEDVAHIEAPVVWSLHDMWPFTGGCHYDEGCGAFKRTCGDCKVLQSGKINDYSSRVFRRKNRTFQKKNDITLIGLSRWIADEAASSALFASQQVINLPNPIDTGIFAPCHKEKARELLNLPQGKKLILFGAVGATSDPRKGFHELAETLKTITTRDAELVVFGASHPGNCVGFTQEAHYLGRFSDDVALRILYSAADVMVVPSLQENLSNAIMESLACGTPVVCFDIGGNKDMVDHGVNGYLAHPFHVADLAAGIDCILQHDAPELIKRNAREKVMRNFESKMVAKKYIEVYRSLLSKDKE